MKMTEFVGIAISRSINVGIRKRTIAVVAYIQPASSYYYYYYFYVVGKIRQNGISGRGQTKKLLIMFVILLI